MDTGTYTLNETFTVGVQADYDSTVTCVDNAAGHTNTGLPNGGTFTAGTPQSVSIDEHDEIVCTFTNSRKAQLAVVKKLDPASDNGTFDLQIDSQTKKTNAGHNDTTGFVNVSNATHTVGEVNGTSSPNQLTDYVSEITCDNGDTNTADGRYEPDDEGTGLRRQGDVHDHEPPQGDHQRRQVPGRQLRRPERRRSGRSRPDRVGDPRLHRHERQRLGRLR